MASATGGRGDSLFPTRAEYVGSELRPRGVEADANESHGQAYHRQQRNAAAFQAIRHRLGGGCIGSVRALRRTPRRRQSPDHAWPAACRRLLAVVLPRRHVSLVTPVAASSAPGRSLCSPSLLTRSRARRQRAHDAGDERILSRRGGHGDAFPGKRCCRFGHRLAQAERGECPRRRVESRLARELSKEAHGPGRVKRGAGEGLRLQRPVRRRRQGPRRNRVVESHALRLEAGGAQPGREIARADPAGYVDEAARSQDKAGPWRAPPARLRLRPPPLSSRSAASRAACAVAQPTARTGSRRASSSGDAAASARAPFALVNRIAWAPERSSRAFGVDVG